MMAKMETSAMRRSEWLSDLEIRQEGFPLHPTPEDVFLQTGLRRKAAYPTSKGLFVIEYRDELPPWFTPLMKRLLSLVELPSGWDSHGALPVNPRAVREALNLLSHVMDPRTPPPSVVPTTGGLLQMEWHRRGVDLEIELLPEHRVQLAFEDRQTGEHVDQVLTVDLAPLVRCVSALTSRA